MHGILLKKKKQEAILEAIYHQNKYQHTNKVWDMARKMNDKITTV